MTVLTNSAGVVVGVGNPVMADDGFGQTVLRRIETSESGSGTIRTAFVRTTALLALEALDGAEQAVVVDAVDAEGPPGTVCRYPLDGGRQAPTTSMHDFDFASALDQCDDIYDLPEQIVLVGAVPRDTDPRIGLSQPVRQAVPTVATLARAELSSDHTDRPMQATWYCVDCDTEISADAVDEHESKEHSVTGRLTPDRLLSNDPGGRDDGGSDSGGGH